MEAYTLTFYTLSKTAAKSYCSSCWAFTEPTMNAISKSTFMVLVLIT